MRANRMKYPKIFHSISQIAKKLPWVIAEHFFLFFLSLTGIFLVITGSIFLRYRDVPIGKYEMQGIQFQMGGFQELLEIQGNRRKIFDQQRPRETQNIFHRPALTEISIEL